MLSVTTCPAAGTATTRCSSIVLRTVCVGRRRSLSSPARILLLSPTATTTIRPSTTTTTTTIRFFSDKLLGHSPMAQGGHVISSSSTQIPTLEQAKIGGIWQATTAKRDKLAELKSELALSRPDDNAVPDLEDAATPRQKRDLWLADGLLCITKQATAVQTTTTVQDDNDNEPFSVTNTVWTRIQEAISGKDDGISLHQVQWEEVLDQSVIQPLEQALSQVPGDRCLAHVRVYYDASTALEAMKPNEEHTNNKRLWDEWINQHQINGPESNSNNNNNKTDNNFASSFVEATIRFRLQRTLCAAKQLRESWKVLTAVTDQEKDRAAVRHEEAADASTLPAGKLLNVLRAYLIGNGRDQMEAVWNLMDKDDDGLIDQEEMKHVIAILMRSAEQAVLLQMDDALQAAPVGLVSEPKGWRQRRREQKDKKKLTRIFDRTIKKHFEEELEIHHRLRCIYAWANKDHQSNQIDSVLVEEEGGGIATGIMGRKRYVELHPKIALPEFRQVQTIHLLQLDNIVLEYLHSFREDLLVLQGKGRQNRELMRDCALFFTGVCVLDYIILSL